MSHGAEQRLIRRSTVASWLVGGLFTLCVVSQAKVQIFERDSTLALAKKSNRLAVSRTDYASRGSIISADGIALAESDDSFTLSIDYRQVPHSEAFFIDLARAAGVPVSELSQPAAKGLKNRVWQGSFGTTKRNAINDVKTRWRADGISVGRTLGRRYGLDVCASTFVGVVRDGSGILGLERSQNEVLGGRNGMREGLIDRTGAFLPMRMSENAVDKIEGRDLHLTIDSGLQREAFFAVRDSVEANKANSGVAVVIEPATGRILAMANWPAYDPNAAQFRPGAERNEAIMCAYEPGSTFKILTLAMALDCGVVSAGTTVQCSGTLNYSPSWRIRCDTHGGRRAHGLCDLEKAIAKSCNVSAATWALKIGHERFTKYLDEFGLTRPTRVGLPQETTGSYNREEYAKALQLMTFGFGQSMTATPLQLASAFAAIGNAGLREEPKLIDAIGETPLVPPKGRQIVTSETADRVLKLMESVIETDAGTGSKLRIPGYRLAGKTGTAEKVNARHEAGYVSSFVGFVPAQKPKACILVMIDRPSAGKYYGASVAGPVFRRIAMETIRRFNIPVSSSSTESKE